MTREEAIEILKDDAYVLYEDDSPYNRQAYDMAIEALKLPQGVIYCKDCRWWDKKDENGTYGYCHAIKHSYYSRHWEINIYRTYEEDFYCADAELRTEEEEGEE